MRQRGPDVLLAALEMVGWVAVLRPAPVFGRPWWTVGMPAGAALRAEYPRRGSCRLFVPFIFANPPLSPCLSVPTTGSLVVPQETPMNDIPFLFNAVYSIGQIVEDAVIRQHHQLMTNLMCDAIFASRARLSGAVLALRRRSGICRV